MNTRLYHRDIGFPEVVTDQLRALGDVKLSYTRHAMQACLNDRFGAIYSPLHSCRILPENVIEAEVVDGIVVKVVCRYYYDEKRDLCLALAVAPRACRDGWAIVKTVWSNLRSDTHSTLDRSKYNRP